MPLGRKAWLFCGSDHGGQRAAVLYTLIQTARLNNVDPKAWLADVLARIVDHPIGRLDWIAPDRFNIQWHRHTGAWFRIHRGKTLAQALKLIETDGILHPN